MRFTTDKTSGVPLYRQLAHQIRAAIDAGTYREGERLPTEAELFETAGVSKGTIKAAYEQLRQMGCIRKVQGSGAYVQRPTGEELKTRAAQLTSHLFEELSKLPDISASNAYALFREELRREFAGAREVNAALVICAPELLDLTLQRLSGVAHLAVSPFLMGDIVGGSRLIDGDYDFLLTTQSHSADLIRYAAAMKLRMEKMELTESGETLAELAKLPAAMPVGILYRSAYFYGNIVDTFRTLGLHNPVEASPEQDAAVVFATAPLGAMALIVPPDYERNSNQATLDLVLEVKASGGRVIPFQYVMDRGSLLHLEARVGELYAAKNGAGGAAFGFFRE